MVQTYLSRYSRQHVPPRGLALLAAAVGLLAYVWTRGVYFLQDDLALSWITKDGRLDAGQVFRWALPTWQVRDEVLRPLPVLSFASDFLFFGVRAGFYHAVNAAFHGLNAALLLLLAFRLGAHRAAAFAAAVLWALYPGHVEAVAWILHRMVLQALFFALVSIHLHLGWARRGGGWRLAGALAGYLLALACKETAFILPAVVALLSFFEGEGKAGARLRRAALHVLPWLGVFGAYLLWRLASFGRIVVGYGEGHTFFEYAAREDYVEEMVRALVRFVFPVNPDHGSWALPAAGWGAALLAATGLAVAGRRVGSLQAAGAGLLLVSLVTAAPFLRVDEGLVNSRHHYFPAAGLALLLAARRGGGTLVRLGLLAAGAAGSWAALRHNAEPYLEAGRDVRALQSQGVEALSRLPPGTRLVLAEVPARRAGAPAFGSPTSVQAAFEPPFVPARVAVIALMEGTTYDLDAVVYGLHPPPPGEGPAALFRFRSATRELQGLGSPASLFQMNPPRTLRLVTPPEGSRIRLLEDPPFRFEGGEELPYYRILFRVAGRVHPVTVERGRLEETSPGRMEYRLGRGDLFGRKLLALAEVQELRGEVIWWVEGVEDPKAFRSARARSEEGRFIVEGG